MKKTDNDKLRHVYYDYSDWSEHTQVYFSDVIEKYKDSSINKVLYSVYQGSLFYGQYLSKKHNIPHNIVKFQSRDGDDRKAKIYTFDKVEDPDRIFIIDDILDTGKTIRRVLDEVIDYHEILPDHYNKITVLVIYAHPNVAKDIETLYPGVEVRYTREATGRWIDFFTEGVPFPLTGDDDF